jgi:hypothetical protein
MPRDGAAFSLEKLRQPRPRQPSFSRREKASCCRNENFHKGRCLRFAARLAQRVNVRAMRNARILLKCFAAIGFYGAPSGCGERMCRATDGNCFERLTNLSLTMVLRASPGSRASDGWLFSTRQDA